MMEVLFLFYELAAHQKVNADTESNDMTNSIGYPMEWINVHPKI